MNTNDYLEKILSQQNLSDDSAELKKLQEHRKNVEKIIREAFPDSGATIRYGGSKAKGTLNREAYDLDIICYFPHDGNDAGESLKDIYNNVSKALSPSYYVQPKTSAIRLKDLADTISDLHIDVVPGRFVDDSKSDCFLHQEGGEKERLKTNLDVHISHVRDSSVVPAIRLLKLWKVRRQLRIRQFVFELLTIEILNGDKKEELADQLKRVWNELAQSKSPITVTDPANPGGNDLSPLLTPEIWNELAAAAEATRDVIKATGWEGVFGPVSHAEGDTTQKLRLAAMSVTSPTKPWLPYGKGD